jgi:hypothetical protein
MNLAARVITHLERNGVMAAIIGGVALGAHGVARATLDTDILVADGAILSPTFWRTLRSAPDPQIRRGDADDPLAGVVRLARRSESVDVLVGRGVWMRRVLERRTWLRLPRHKLPFVDRADLVLLKLYAGGPQDLLDVQLLVETDPGGLREAVEHRLAHVPRAIAARWRRLAG